MFRVKSAATDTGRQRSQDASVSNDPSRYNLALADYPPLRVRGNLHAQFFHHKKSQHPLLSGHPQHNGGKSAVMIKTLVMNCTIYDCVCTSCLLRQFNLRCRSRNKIYRVHSRIIFVWQELSTPGDTPDKVDLARRATAVLSAMLRKSLVHFAGGSYASP